MRLSINQFKHKQGEHQNFEGEDAIMDSEDTHKVKGGDKEYNPPLYEQKHKGFWHQANMLLDNLK